MALTPEQRAKKDALITPEQRQQMEANKLQFLEIVRTIQRPGIDNLINWLVSETDFFVAPASTKYHLHEDGGLCLHSLHVYSALCAKKAQGLINLSDDSIALTALFHDLCKANFYEEYQKWRKDANNKWEDYYPWGVRETSERKIFGHGEASVFMLMRYVYLSDEEIAMIRFHMGPEQVSAGVDGFSYAAAHYPSVCALHTADLEAAYIYEHELNHEEKVAMGLADAPSDDPDMGL